MFNIAASRLLAPLQRLMGCNFVNICPIHFIFVLGYSRCLCGSNAPNDFKNGPKLKKEFRLQPIYMEIAEKTPLVLLIRLDDRPKLVL